MAKLTRKQLSQNGTTIMSMAAKIRKAKPKKMWKECVAEAGKLFGKTSVKTGLRPVSTKRKPAKVKKVKKTTKRK